MKPPEPIIVFDCNFVGIAVARDGKVSVDGVLYNPSDVYEITNALIFLADAANRQSLHNGLRGSKLSDFDGDEI